MITGISSSMVETEPSGGWLAQLDLDFCYRADKTVLSHRKQLGPLAVQRAFYPEGDVCHLYILHPPGGIVGGDNLTINVHVEDNAHTLLTTPGATKVYRSQGKQAQQQQYLYIADKAALEWMPQENIYFPGAKIKIKTQLNVHENARVIAWDIHCFGLPANDEIFTSGEVQLDFSIIRDQRPLLIERMKINSARLNTPTGLRGNAVMAMLLASPADEQLLETIQMMLDDYSEQLVAVTLVEECLLLRYLGNSTAQCHKIFIQVWMILRPAILNRPACPPRIWAT